MTPFEKKIIKDGNL